MSEGAKTMDLQDVAKEKIKMAVFVGRGDLCHVIRQKASVTLM